MDKLLIAVSSPDTGLQFQRVAKLGQQYLNFWQLCLSGIRVAFATFTSPHSLCASRHFFLFLFSLSCYKPCQNVCVSVVFEITRFRPLIAMPCTLKTILNCSMASDSSRDVWTCRSLCTWNKTAVCLTFTSLSRIAACMLPLARHPFSKTFTEIFAAIIDRKPEKTTCPAILQTIRLSNLAESGTLSDGGLGRISSVQVLSIVN